VYRLAELADQAAELVDAGFGEPVEERLSIGGTQGVHGPRLEGLSRPARRAWSHRREAG